MSNNKSEVNEKLHAEQIRQRLTQRNKTSRAIINNSDMLLVHWSLQKDLMPDLMKIVRYDSGALTLLFPSGKKQFHVFNNHPAILKNGLTTIGSWIDAITEFLKISIRSLIQIDSYSGQDYGNLYVIILQFAGQQLTLDFSKNITAIKKNFFELKKNHETYLKHIEQMHSEVLTVLTPHTKACPNLELDYIIERISQITKYSNIQQLKNNISASLLEIFCYLQEFQLFLEHDFNLVMSSEILQEYQKLLKEIYDLENKFLKVFATVGITQLPRVLYVDPLLRDILTVNNTEPHCIPYTSIEYQEKQITFKLSQIKSDPLLEKNLTFMAEFFQDISRIDLRYITFELVEKIEKKSCASADKEQLILLKMQIYKWAMIRIIQVITPLYSSNSEETFTKYLPYLKKITDYAAICACENFQAKINKVREEQPFLCAIINLPELWSYFVSATQYINLGWLYMLQRFTQNNPDRFRDHIKLLALNLQNQKCIVHFFESLGGEAISNWVFLMNTRTFYSAQWDVRRTYDEWYLSQHYTLGNFPNTQTARLRVTTIKDSLATLIPSVENIAKSIPSSSDLLSALISLKKLFIDISRKAGVETLGVDFFKLCTIEEGDYPEISKCLYEEMHAATDFFNKEYAAFKRARELQLQKQEAAQKQESDKMYDSVYKESLPTVKPTITSTTGKKAKKKRFKQKKVKIKPVIKVAESVHENEMVKKTTLIKMGQLFSDALRKIYNDYVKHEKEVCCTMEQLNGYTQLNSPHVLQDPEIVLEALLKIADLYFHLGLEKVAYKQNIPQDAFDAALQGYQTFDNFLQKVGNKLSAKTLYECNETLKLSYENYYKNKKMLETTLIQLEKEEIWMDIQLELSDKFKAIKKQEYGSDWEKHRVITVNGVKKRKPLSFKARENIELRAQLARHKQARKKYHLLLIHMDCCSKNISTNTQQPKMQDEKDNKISVAFGSSSTQLSFFKVLFKDSAKLSHQEQNIVSKLNQYIRLPASYKWHVLASNSSYNFTNYGVLVDDTPEMQQFFDHLTSQLSMSPIKCCQLQDKHLPGKILIGLEDVTAKNLQALNSVSNSHTSTSSSMSMNPHTF